MANENKPDHTQPRGNASEDAAENWIFVPEPGTLPTEKLPDRADFERYRRERAHIDNAAEPYFAPGLAPHEPHKGSASSASPQRSREPATVTAEISLPAVAPASADPAARSGSTPNVAPRANPIAMPPRFRDLSGWDALRDLLAIFAFISALTTTFTHAYQAVPTYIPGIAIGISILSLVLVYLLRWAPTYRKDYEPKKPAEFAYLGVIRKVGMVPSLLVGLGIMAYDLALSIPDLLTPLPDGPKAGVGAGVALIIFGAVIGSERRGFEGFVPGPQHKNRAGRWLAVIRALGFASFALALVMMVGKAFSGDLLFSIVTFANSLGSLALFSYLVKPKLNSKPSWYVFLAGVGVALVAGAAADSSLRLDFSAPGSFSTSFVWLPFLCAGIGLLLSRSYVRSTPLRFARVDWVVYAARAFEFSFVMHLVALATVAFVALAVALGYQGRMGLMLESVNIVFVVAFTALSGYARRALNFTDGIKARGHAVSASVGLTVLGFVGIVTYSLAAGEAAGLTTGGLALVVGIAAALMLTVPAPVRDEYGAPDVERMFSKFRERSIDSSLAMRFIPDVSRARAERKFFPSAK